VVPSCPVVTASACALWLLSSAAVQAHRLPPEVTAFFREDATSLRVLVRVPTAVLLDARLPIIEGAYLDLRTIDDRLRSVAGEVTRTLEVADTGRLLTSGPPAWILSPPGDASFSSFETAEGRFQQPPIPADRYVYWNEAFADFRFDYPLANGPHHVSARLNGLRMGGDFFQTRATYLPISGKSRQYTIVGSPQRIDFEPSLGGGVSTFLTAATTTWPRQWTLVLLLLCLASPGRASRDLWRAFWVFALAHVATGAFMAMRGQTLAAPVTAFTQIVAGAALIAVALQTVVGASSTLVVAVFGVATGAILGSEVSDLVPLAGSFAAPGLLAFYGLMVAGGVLVLSLLQQVVAALGREHRLERLATLVVSIIAAHQGTHILLDTAARLQDDTLEPAGPLQRTLTGHWPIVALALTLVVVLLMAFNGRSANTEIAPNGSPAL
jgi:hypothetical protein